MSAVWDQLLIVLKKGHKNREEFMEPNDWQSNVMRQINASNFAATRASPIESANGFIWQLCACSLIITICLQGYLSAVMPSSNSSDVYTAAFSSSNADFLWRNN